MGKLYTRWVEPQMASLLFCLLSDILSWHFWHKCTLIDICKCKYAFNKPDYQTTCNLQLYTLRLQATAKVTITTTTTTANTAFTVVIFVVCLATIKLVMPTDLLHAFVPSTGSLVVTLNNIIKGIRAWALTFWMHWVTKYTSSHSFIKNLQDISKFSCYSSLHAFLQSMEMPEVLLLLWRHCFFNWNRKRPVAASSTV